MTATRFLAFSAAAVVAISLAVSRSASASADDEGFTPLFPDEKLAGWHFSDWSDLTKEPQTDGPYWKLEDGVLEALGKRTWIFSERTYGDFALKCEFKIGRGANGGIGLRFPPEGDPAYRAMEIQLVDAEVYYGGQARPEQKSGSIYDEIAARSEPFKPVGEWNAVEITCRGPHVTIVVNGETALEADLSKETKARQQKGPPLAERPREGRIGFQNLNGHVLLRNVLIKPLD